MADYILVDTVDKARDTIHALQSRQQLSVDCEGVSLGRTGELCLLQIAIPQRVYLFDIFVLREKVFDIGLREILERESCVKLFYDCREDCSALKHQYNVEVKGIEDIQLLALLNMKLSGKRWQFVSGLQKCMSYHLGDCGFSGAEKARVHTALDNDKGLWRQRPISQDLLRYAAKDVMYLPNLKDKILSRISVAPRSSVLDTIRYASKRYADFMINNEGPEDSPYIGTARLPERIIPNMVRRGGVISYTPFEDTSVKCRSCFWYTGTTRSDGQCNRCYDLYVEKLRAAR
ncbi:piRNA biogenesis protein EXD1-like [Watersipora subatra]|uniref:piRNA biogenesis protein EXD1-like n=1 Tax=Watersipora subatra TaxID=2589382 RepID=UPI00355BF985